MSNSEISLRVRVETSRPIGARAAGRFLASIAVMRDGLALAIQGDKNDLLRSVYDKERIFWRRGFFWGRPSIARFLLDVGRRGLEGSDRLAAGQFLQQTDAWRALSLVEYASPADELSLVSLQAGSLEARVEEVLERIGVLLGRLLRRHSGERAELREAMEEIEHSSEASPRERLIGLGIIVVAQRNYEEVLSSIDAEEVSTEAGIRSEVGGR